MENKIELRLIESLSFAEKRFKNDDINRFEDAIIEFEDLVKRGFARKRGNTLLSISDLASLPPININGIKVRRTV